MTFEESGLRFSFASNWVVKKYDEHPYFRALSGNGLKGVDFIAIRDQRELIFIEVKNYRTRYNAKMNVSFDVNVKPAPELAFELKRKLEDTLLAIDAVLQYYHRSWWFRRFRGMWMRWPFLQHNRAFWTLADSLVQYHLHYVVWLALDRDDPEDYEEQLIAELAKFDLHILDQMSVTNTSEHIFKEEVIVKLLE
ncbi:MAG: hypothetical protein KDD15_20920 [Lewinella sp.]|nr:hypothetical protein [Lewinella sp.]